eukprot:3818238-Rhodomonas_salina.1
MEASMPPQCRLSDAVGERLRVLCVKLLTAHTLCAVRWVGVCMCAVLVLRGYPVAGERGGRSFGCSLDVVVL